MTNIVKLLSRFCFVALGISVVNVAMSASIYVYVHTSGTKLITDHPRSDLPGYTLQKKYSADDHFGSPDGRSGYSPSTRETDYDDLIKTVANQFQIDPALLKAVVHIESSFNPEALSPKGALGLMQLMPATAERYGVNHRTDPMESLTGGSRYLRDLLKLFSDDTQLALAAYNAGENNVTRYNGIPPFPETQNYVEKVMRLWDQYRDQGYGA